MTAATYAWRVMLVNFAKQLAGYGVASVVALATDMALYTALVQLAKLGYVTAATISFLAGVVVAWVLSTRLAFKEHRFGSVRTEFLMFAAIGIIGLVINDAVIGFATARLALNYVVAKLLATGFTFLCNFFLRRQMLFVKSKNLQGRQVATDQSR